MTCIFVRASTGVFFAASLCLFFYGTTDWKKEENLFKKYAVAKAEMVEPLPLLGQTFPRWVGENVNLSSLIDHIRVAVNLTYQDPRNVFGFDQVHIIDSTYKLQTIVIADKSIHDDRRVHGRLRRAAMTLPVYKEALALMHNRSGNYPHFTKIVKGSGIFFLISYGDSKQCNPYPVATLSARLDCYNTFPIPGYDLANTAKKIHLQQKTKPWMNASKWKSLRRQVIWRGSSTGEANMSKNERANLCFKALEFPDLVDAKLVWNNAPYLQERISDTRFEPIIGEKSNFTGYRGVLDVDGNSWSSRFASLLCSNQVVLKIQPHDVNYFYPRLQPEVHYLPIHANLSNLEFQAQRAVSDNSDIQVIIRNAHKWCEKQMRLETLASDMADILEAYASILIPDVNVAQVFEEFGDHVVDYLSTPALLASKN